MKHWTEAGRRIATAMLFALAMASCDHAAAPTDVSEPQQLLGILDPVTEAVGDVLAPERTVRAVDENGEIREYRLVREPILDLNPSELRVSDVIGVSGGQLELLGHRIVVPAGAVDIPTLFTLVVLPTGYVQVDISAFAGDLLGGVSDVGEEGFNRPVQLDMTYERATNVKNPRKLVILRLNPDGLDGLHEALPSTVDRRNERVTVQLDHFSGYAMAF